MGRVGPFGLAVEGFMGGAVGMDAEKPDQINAIRMDAERVNNQAEWGWGMKSLIGQRQ